MTPRGWLSTLIVPVRALNGDVRQVITGLIQTEGGPQIAMRVGEDGELVILPLQATNELIANLRDLADERLKLERTARTDGGADRR